MNRGSESRLLGAGISVAIGKEQVRLTTAFDKGQVNAVYQRR
jgi:hypothetical protein